MAEDLTFQRASPGSGETVIEFLPITQFVPWRIGKQQKCYSTISVIIYGYNNTVNSNENTWKQGIQGQNVTKQKRMRNENTVKKTCYKLLNIFIYKEAK